MSSRRDAASEAYDSRRILNLIRRFAGARDRGQENRYNSEVNPNCYGYMEIHTSKLNIIVAAPVGTGRSTNDGYFLKY